MHHSSCPSYPTTSCSSKTIPSAGANGKPKQRQTALSTARNSITYDAYYWPDERAASRRNALDVPPQEMAHTRASPFHKPFFEIADTDFTDQYFLRHRDDQVERQAAVKPQVCIPDRFPGNKETGFITFLLFQCPQQTPDPGLLSDSGSGGPRLEQRCSIES